MFYVYYLLDPDNEDLLYIGRSHRPRRRKAEFVRLHQREVVLGVSQRFGCFDKSCLAELQAIKKHSPPYNKHKVSSPGNLGGEGTRWYRHTDEAKRKIQEAGLGRKLSPEHAAKLLASAVKRRGRPQTEEHKQKIRQAHLGKKRSPQAKANMSAAQQRRKNEVPSTNSH